MATVQLFFSTPTLNMASAWNLGYRGAGQNIIVMDTGVQSSHIFFQNASGASRVTYEACFGSNATAYYPPTNTYYTVQSACANGAGSVLGVPRAAAPVPNCSSVDPFSCAHGTHVAGIAAGKNNPSFGLGTDFQGVAPDANIIAVQVFSYDPNRIYPPRAITADLVAAMQVAANAMTPGTSDNPYVVSLSLGGNPYASNCDDISDASIAFAAAVHTLTNNGVPVVAATGNNGYYGSISWPSCITGVIKVGATANDQVGATISSFTNRPDMSAFAGEAVYMVPGGSTTSSVASSVPDYAFYGAVNNGVLGFAGTSQATPHVAGLYAIFKSVVPGTTIQNATAWFQQSAGTAMTPVCSAGPCQPYYRIRLPAL